MILSDFFEVDAAIAKHCSSSTDLSVEQGLLTVVRVRVKRLCAHV